MATPAWELNSFSKLQAWNEASNQKTYQELNADLQKLAVPASRIWLQEDQGAYQSALWYLKAWTLGRTLCLIPKSWPAAWKQDIQHRLQKFETQIPNNCFYLLPTSGSTGQPKLVAVSRENWQALLQSLLPIYVWQPSSRVALTFEGGFDPFIAILFLALSQGATLFPLGDADRFNIFSFLHQKQIQIWSSVPSLAQMNWSRKPAWISKLPSLRQTLFTGETLSPELLRLWKNLAPSSPIENLYGPVETTVWATRHVCEEADLQAQLISIGQPLASVQASVQAGELVIKGSQVALGYLSANGMELFSGSYQTGDQVDCKEGRYYFKGRLDQQVKLRGQRVELEAIENALLIATKEHGVCLVDSAQNLCLVLPKPLNLEALFTHLQSQLPASHLPRQFYICPAWPLTASGKMDRQILLKKIEAQELQKLNLQKDAG